MSDNVLMSVVTRPCSGPADITDKIWTRSTETITIRVDAETAKAFKSLSEEDRRRLEAILSIRLTEITQGGESMEAVMQEISEKAKARGLTPEILKSLLDED